MNYRGFAQSVQHCGKRGIAFLVLLLSVACSPAAPPPTPSPVPFDVSRTPVTITFWHTQTGAARTQLNAFSTEFSKIYPWITVRAEAKANEGDMLRLGIAAVALNQTPDLIIANLRTISEFARGDTLLNLDPLMDDALLGIKGEDRSDFLPGALETGRLAENGNHLLALPFDAHAVIMYYNADYVRAAKLNLPPRTWDDLAAAAWATTRDSARGWAMVPDASVFYAFLFSRHGSVLNEAQTQIQFNGEAGLKSLQMISALSKGGAAYLAENAASARSDFALGKTAFLFEETQELDSISAAIAKAGAKFQWGIANIPQDDAGATFTTLEGSSVAIFKTSVERERAAWLFARWLASPEPSAQWSRASLGIPVRLSARALLASHPPTGWPLSSFNNLDDPLPTGRGVPTVKDSTVIDQAIVEMWTAVANGTDPATAMSRAVTRASRVVGQKP